jgi:N-acyl-L-homoserine lactone synthetase
MVILTPELSRFVLSTARLPTRQKERASATLTARGLADQAGKCSLPMDTSQILPLSSTAFERLISIL